MNPTVHPENTLSNEPAVGDDLMQWEITQWELRIAQRADQLAACAAPRSQVDLVYWMQAEREILAHLHVIHSEDCVAP